jgi:hypothetical protein
LGGALRIKPLPIRELPITLRAKIVYVDAQSSSVSGENWPAFDTAKRKREPGEIEEKSALARFDRGRMLALRKV